MSTELFTDADINVVFANYQAFLQGKEFNFLITSLSYNQIGFEWALLVTYAVEI